MNYKLTASFHKGTCSSSHLNHNRRKNLNLSHVDTFYTVLYNKCYVDMELSTAYEKLFGDALRTYNSKKRPSERIPDYLEHIQKQFEERERKYQEAKSSGASRKALAKIRSRYSAPYNEVIVSIGNADLYDGSFCCGRENEQIAVDILDEYMRSFQERNPHLFVFSAFMHRDEVGGKTENGMTSNAGVPHLHICYIPWTDEKGRGLPVRVSESGALRQQNLSSPDTFSTILYQEQERKILSEIALQHQVEIIEGKHAKKHISKSAYILQQEQEKAKADHELINSQAGELIKYQDELVAFLRSHGIEDSFVQHIENISLKQDVAELEAMQERNKKVIASAWQDYNDYTASFFASYRENKQMLWEEIQKARKTSYLNKKRLEDLIFDITEGSDFFLIKLFKLVAALFVAIDNIQYEKEVERLQEANRVLKQQAKEIMSQSSDVSTVLRSKQLDDIERALANYEDALEKAKSFVDDITRCAGLITNYEMGR